MSVKICPSCKMYTNVKGKKCPNSECDGRLFKVPNEWVAAATSALEKGYILAPDNWLFYPSWINNNSYFGCILTPICTVSIPCYTCVDTVYIGKNDKPKSMYHDDTVSAVFDNNIIDNSMLSKIDIDIARKSGTQIVINPLFVSQIKIYFESPRDFCNRLIEMASHDSRIKIDFYTRFYDYMYNIKRTVIDICNTLPTIEDGFLYIGEN